MTRTPNLFVVGAAKSGTSSLHDHLSIHPDVFMSRVKEPHHYADVDPSEEMRHLVKRYDDDEYTALFASATSEKYVGESSPSYLWDRNSAQRIRASAPDARIIVSLRDPVMRAYSHYLMDYREGLTDKPFAQALSDDIRLSDKRWASHGHLYVELGLYAEQLQRYLAAFPRNQIHIVDFHTLAANQKQVLDQLADFLGIPATGFAGALTASASNPYRAPRSRAARAVMGDRAVRRIAQRVVPSRVRRTIRDRMLLAAKSKPELDEGTARSLQAIYEPELDRLERLLGEPMPNLRANWV